MEAEFNSIPRHYKQEVEALHKELLAWLQATLAEGREAGVFNFNGEPANKAALILSICRVLCKWLAHWAQKSFGMWLNSITGSARINFLSSKLTR